MGLWVARAGRQTAVVVLSRTYGEELPAEQDVVQAGWGVARSVRSYEVPSSHDGEKIAFLVANSRSSACRMVTEVFFA